MKEIRSAIMMLALFTVICGGAYPVLVTGIAQGIFPEQANGSMITGKDRRLLGSTLLGQPFSAPEYFWGRPSATAQFGYNPMASGGSNAGPGKPEYLQTVQERVKLWRDSGVAGAIPAELVQASASGLDPHLTPASVALQIPRVARARGISEADLGRLVAAHTEGRQLGFLGDPRVNVLLLNLALDGRGR